MTTVESGLHGLVRIEDPQFYLDDPFPVFARMRAEAPVFYYEPLDTFVLTKHEDIRLVNRNSAIFSNGRSRTRSSRPAVSRSGPPTRRGTTSCDGWRRPRSPRVRCS